MAVTHKTGRKLGNENTWSVGIIAWMAVVAMASLGILLSGPLFSPGRIVYAAPHRSNEPWLKIKCLEPLVEEGEDFRLEVRKKRESDWPHPTMRVFWYTEFITADESDYEHLYAERQSSNSSQSESGVMGRNFQTTEDLYSETAETFKVRFNNSVDQGHDGECIITIVDDDGVGIYELEIASEPREIPGASDDGGSLVGYSVGDVIEITAHFTGTVTTVNPDTGERADYAGLYIQVGENCRIANLLRGEGTDTLVFGYTVQEDDDDADGISVEGGGIIFRIFGKSRFTGFYFNKDAGDIGLWPSSSDSEFMNRLYDGLDDDPGHVVVRVQDEEENGDDGDQTETITLPSPSPTPEPEEWVKSSLSVESNLRGLTDGELTEEQGLFKV